MKKLFFILAAVMMAASAWAAEAEQKSIFGNFLAIQPYSEKAFLGQKDNTEINIIYNDLDGDKTTVESLILQRREFYTKWDPVTHERTDTLIEQIISYISIDSIVCITAPMLFLDYNTIETKRYEVYGHGDKRWSEYYNPQVQNTYNRLRSVRKNEQYKEAITPEFYQYLCNVFNNDPTYVKEQMPLLDDLQTRNTRVVYFKEFVPNQSGNRVILDRVYIISDENDDRDVVYENNIVKDNGRGNFEATKVQIYPDTLFKYVSRKGVEHGFRRLGGIGTETRMRYRITDNDTIIDYISYQRKMMKVLYFDPKSIKYIQEKLGNQFVTHEIIED